MGVKRTSRKTLGMSAYDPKRAFSSIHLTTSSQRVYDAARRDDFFSISTANAYRIEHFRGILSGGTTNLQVLDLECCQANNDHRSSYNQITIRGALSHYSWMGSFDSSCLAIRRILLLFVQKDRHRLVFTIRRDHGSGRSGSHL